SCSTLFAVALLAIARLNVGSVVAADQQEAVSTLASYVRATYARDYEEAYSHIATADQRLKDRASYVRDRGAFSGFTLEVARVLASYIELQPIETRVADGQARIRIKFEVPDAGNLGPALHHWDSDQLEALSDSERKALLASIDKLGRNHAFEMVQGEDVFEVIKEGGSWKIVLNWASPVNVGFQTSVPSSVPVEAHLIHSDVVTRPGEIFKVVLNVKNTSQEHLFARIGHLVDPYGVRDYLDLVDCGFLLPVRLAPGKEEEFVSTYLLRKNLPEGVRQLNVTYAVTLGSN
ncbi:MAG TPA: cytochrome c oxidase assembly protein, partial [Candidatus Polarisedimenticolaceae bacterium]|nr:cytochrome c oxidase assembly protein [Candidatus Polarisedimenticolaceae bacterium]